MIAFYVKNVFLIMLYNNLDQLYNLKPFFSKRIIYRIILNSYKNCIYSGNNGYLLIQFNIIFKIIVLFNNI